MNKPLPACHNEHGFVLVAAMLCLVVLTLIGIAAMNTSFFEKTIAQNMNLAEKTFYGADGGSEVGIEMIEQNLSCPKGFTGTPLPDNDPGQFYRIGGIQITDSSFAYDEDMNGLPWDANPATAGVQAAPAITANDFPADNARSIRIPDDLTIPAAQMDAAPHTNLAIFGVTGLGAGSAVHMAAGYEGKGKGAAGGGAVVNYEVFSQRFDILNSEAVIRLGWRHLIGSEGVCGRY